MFNRVVKWGRSLVAKSLALIVPAVAIVPGVAMAQLETLDTTDALAYLALGAAAIAAIGAVKLAMAGLSVVYSWAKGSIFS